MSANDITTVAGGGSAIGDGVPALGAAIGSPGNIAVGADGDLFISTSNTVKLVPATSGTQFGIAMIAGNVYTIAGNGRGVGDGSACTFSSGGVPATSLQLCPAGGSEGSAIAVDGAGNLFIGLNRFAGGWVQQVANSSGTNFGIAMTAGFAYTVAGNGAAGRSGDGGPATSASFTQVSALAVDSEGNVLIADRADSSVLEVAAVAGTHFGVAMTANNIYTVVGNGLAGNGQVPPNGSQPQSAALTLPDKVAVNAGGDLFVKTGAGSEVVLLIPAVSGTRFGISMTADQVYAVAGGGFGSDFGGPATGFRLLGPQITTNTAGDLLISNNSRSVLEVPASSGSNYGVDMTAGNIYQVAGDGSQGFAGDGGPALSAKLNTPIALAVDTSKNLFISDQGNGRIRRVVSSATTSLPIAGTVSYQNNGETLPVPRAFVQACAIMTGTCTPVGVSTAGNGNYSLTVPGPDTYVVTAYPSPGSVSLPVSAGTSGPIAVNAPAGATAVNLVLPPEFPIPPGITVNGQSGGARPVSSWGTPTSLSVQGCPGGLGLVLFTSTDRSTGDTRGLLQQLTETPSGSGTYEATVPSLAPMSGSATVRVSFQCPQIPQMSPASGPGTGANSVTILGSGFSGATEVAFGSAPATSFTVLSDTTIDAVVPAGAGRVPVTVTLPGESPAPLGDYTYVAVSGVSTSAGSDTVTVSGSGFAQAAALYFGDVAASSWSIDSDSQITATLPAGATLEVLVLTADGGASSDAAAAPSLASAASEVPATASAPGAGVSVTQANSLLKNGVTKFVGNVIKKLGRDCATAGLGPALLAALQESVSAVLNSKLSLSALLAGIATPFVGAALVLFFPEIAAGVAATMAVVGVALAFVNIVNFLTDPSGAGPLIDCIGRALPPPPQYKCRGAHCTFGFPGTPFNLKIDPSGTIEDTNGNLLSGATVTLLRSDSPTGPFSAPPSGSPLMDPSVNPQTTAENGFFMWDVVAGYYQVVASKPGCSAPANPSLSDVSTPTLPVPPPQLGLVLTLSCPGGPPPQAPTVTGVSAPTGPTEGGTAVTITGSGFRSSSSVSFGPNAATAVQVVSPTVIRAVTPAGTGLVDVTVTTPAGTSETNPTDLYTYLAKPAVAGISPADGPTSGNTVVEVTGSGFEPGSTVRFGPTPASSTAVISASTIKTVAPPGTGAVDLTVTTPGGTSATSTADIFTYSPTGSTTTTTTAPPTSTTLAPTSTTLAPTTTTAPPTTTTVPPTTTTLAPTTTTLAPTTTTVPPPGGFTCLGLPATIVGTPGDDVIMGTSGPDVIYGRNGNDTITGLGGDDIICGGKGNDLLEGSSGNDTVVGMGGQDNLVGGPGDDDLRGGRGDDHLAGNGGNDALHGGAGTDGCAGGKGTNTLSNCEL